MWWVAGALLAFFLVIGPMIGYFTNPWTAWQLAGQDARTASLAPSSGGAPAPGVAAAVANDPNAIVPASAVTVAPGMVSDHTRYLLARAAGWSASDAVIMTAISIAENGPGNPRLLSAPNKDAARSVDAGLLQINSGHWQECGGLEAVLEPLNNFRCGYRIWLRQGFNGWCTYPGGCGGGPGSSYFPQALVRARAAASDDTSPPNQA